MLFSARIGNAKFACIRWREKYTRLCCPSPRCQHQWVALIVCFQCEDDGWQWLWGSEATRQQPEVVPVGALDRILCPAVSRSKFILIQIRFEMD
jgi:hypothetical protein